MTAVVEKIEQYQRMVNQNGEVPRKMKMFVARNNKSPKPIKGKTSSTQVGKYLNRGGRDSFKVGHIIKEVGEQYAKKMEF
jgi:hypothetical protein